MNILYQCTSTVNSTQTYTVPMYQYCKLNSNLYFHILRCREEQNVKSKYIFFNLKAVFIGYHFLGVKIPVKIGTYVGLRRFTLYNHRCIHIILRPTPRPRLHRLLRWKRSGCDSQCHHHCRHRCHRLYFYYYCCYYYYY